MAIYSMSDRTTIVTAGTASIELRTTANDACNVMEIGIFLGAATASNVGIGRPAARGVTPTSPKTVLAEDGNAPPGTVTTAIAWGTAPTVPVNFFRRGAMPATVGAGVIFTFPRGLLVPVNSSLVVWNIATGGVMDIYFVVDE